MRHVWVLGLLAGCVDGHHTIAITVTDPDGDVWEDKVGGETAWTEDEQGKVSASWPAEDDIGNDFPIALTTGFLPYQPGTWQAPWTTLTFDGTAHTTLSDGAMFTVKHVRFTGNPHFPFVQNGTFVGAVDDYAYEGKFDLGPADCEAGGAGCGATVADLKAEASYTIDGWSETTCPNDVLGRYIDGTTLTFSVKDGARVGQAEALDCVVTDNKAGRVICGADDVMKVGGCKWSVTAVFVPGDAPTFSIAAGTLGDCEPTLCEVAATNLSGG